MTINLDQNDELEKKQLSQDIVDQIKISGESRRRFATSGLAVSGIILTLASRPVLGQTFCLSPSAFCSGNTSHHGACPVAGVSSSALLPPDPNEQFLSAFPLSRSDTSYNSRLLSEMLTTPWPDPPLASAIAPVQQVQKNQLGAASYLSTLSASSGSNSKLSKGKGKGTINPTSPTVASVNAPPNPPFQTQELLKHLVIALFRARSGATPYLTVSTIQSMFYEWQASGTFAPTAGVTWNTAQIIEYLILTQN